MATRLLVVFLWSGSLALGACSSAAPSGPDIAGTWDVSFSGTVVQRNDGGPLGTPQTDHFVFSLQRTDSWVTGQLLTAEGQPSGILITGTMSGTSFSYRIETSFGDCSVVIAATTTVNAAGTAFNGTQSQTNCEGRADGTVTGTKRS